MFSCHNKESISFTIDPHYGNLNPKPLKEPVITIDPHYGNLNPKPLKEPFITIDPHYGNLNPKPLKELFLDALKEPYCGNSKINPLTRAPKKKKPRR